MGDFTEAFKSVQRENSSSSSASTNNKPAVSVTTVPKTTPAPKLNKWDQDIHPLIDKYNLQRDMGVFYETTKFMRNVYNGKYDAVMSEFKNSNVDLYNKLSKLKEASNQFTTELKKQQPNAQKLKELYNKSGNMSIDLQSAFSKAGDNSAYRLLTRNGTILKAKEFNKQNSEYEVFNDVASNDVRTAKSTSYWKVALNATFGLGMPILDPTNISANEIGRTYDFLKGKDAEAMSALKTMKNAKTLGWLSQALEGADGNVNHKHQYNSTLLSLSTDLLDRVRRYGTKSDPDLSSKDKSRAASLYQALSRFKDDDYAGKINFLVQNNDFLKGAMSRLGYYETSYIYRKNKNLNNIDLFSNATGNQTAYSDQVQWIDKMDDIYSKFKGNAGTIKHNVLSGMVNDENPISNQYLKDAKELSGKGYANAVKAITDENGDLVSYAKFVKNVYPSLSNMPIEGPTVVGSKYDTYESYDEKYTKASKEILHNHLKSLYGNLAKGYKQTLDVRKSKFDNEASLLSMGIGATSRKGIGFSSVDLSTDKSGRLKSFSGPKQENVSTIWSLLRNEDGTFGNEKGVILPYSSEINTIEKAELNKASDDSNSVMQKFLKSDPSDVKLVFLRDSNVKWYSQYRLINNETGESVVAMLNQNYLRQVKEPMFINSRQSLDEINFAMTNKKNLTQVTDSRNRVIVKNPHFTYDKSMGVYKLHGSYKYKDDQNQDQVMVFENLDKNNMVMAPYGSSIEEATKFFDEFLQRLKNLKYNG